MYLQFFFFLLFGFIYSSLSFPEKPPPVPPKEGEMGEFFWRPATREVVNLMKESINKSVNPCDNFYEFACGKQQSSPASFISKIVTAFEKDVRKFIINEMTKVQDSKAVNATKVILKSCTNGEIEGGKKEHYDMLVKRFSGTPLKEIFSELAVFDMETSFTIRVIAVPPYEADTPSYGPVLMPPSDLNPTSLLRINDVIDFLIPSNTKMAAAVKEYASRLYDISKYAYANKESIQPSTYSSNWIDISTIKRNTASTLMSTPFIEMLDKLISEIGEEVARAHTLAKATMAVYDIEERMQLADNREEECAKYIAKEFPLIVATTIAKSQLTTELKAEVKKVFDNVLDSIVESIESQEWLGKSRETAVKKAREGDQWIGIPEAYHNYTELDAEYEDLLFDGEGTFLDHVADLLRFKQKEKLSLLSLRSMVQFANRQMLLTFNARNSLGSDLTIFTIALLQSPFFYFRFPDFYRYGLLGFIFGHEHGHGLAFNGALGPYFGAEETISESTKDEIERRSQCFIEEFNNEIMTINGTEYKVSPERNFNENIADNTGYLVAFRAYKKLMEGTRRPKLLREFKDYTSEQMFFISTAQIFCSNDAELYHKLMVRKDVHAPYPIRANAVRNSDDFAKAFKCPVGSKMNPQKKCRLWD